MDPRITSHASIIVNYSVRLKKGETIGIYANTCASDLVEAVYREAIRIGAYPIIRLKIASVEPYFYTHATQTQLTKIHDFDWTEAKSLDARIVVLSETNTRALTNIDPSKIAMASKAKRPIRDYILENTRWCLTLHPTEALAQEASMSLEDYQDFVYASMFCDKRDPVKEWEKIELRQDRMIKSIKGARKVRITGAETDLTFSVRGRKFVNSPATQNLPSGEIFTAPVEDSAEGKVYFDIPSIRDGVSVEGMRLEFKKGKVVKATAEKGEDYLRKMLAMDPGASRLGEFGIGTNFGIQRGTGEILFDEKIGGTIHLALGSSYKECRGENVSGLHWDMIKDLRPAPGRPAGQIEIDGKILKVPRN